MWKLLSAAGPARRSSLNGPIGQQRRYTWVSVPLDDIRAINRAMNGTVNDAVLRGHHLRLRALTSWPVGKSLSPTWFVTHARVNPRPRRGERLDNRVSAMIVDLPVEIDDPPRRCLLYAITSVR